MILWCKQISTSISIFKNLKFSLWNKDWIFVYKQIRDRLEFEYVHLLVYLSSFRLFPCSFKQKAAQMRIWEGFLLNIVVLVVASWIVF